jgi:hypothetical protein
LSENSSLSEERTLKHAVLSKVYSARLFQSYGKASVGFESRAAQIHRIQKVPAKRKQNNAIDKAMDSNLSTTTYALGDTLGNCPTCTTATMRLQGSASLELQTSIGALNEGAASTLTRPHTIRKNTCRTSWKARETPERDHGGAAQVAIWR